MVLQRVAGIVWLEVPIGPKAEVARFEKDLAKLGPAVQDCRDLIRELQRRLGLADGKAAELRQAVARSAAPAAAAQVPAARSPLPARAASTGVSNFSERSGVGRMLAALAGAPEGMSRTQLAMLAGMKVSGGSFGTYLSRLRAAGHLEDMVDGRVCATEAGLAAAGGARPPASVEEVRQLWLQRMSGGALRMLEHLIRIAPGGVTRADLAEAVQMEEAGGSFGTYLSRLRSNGLLREEGGQVFAAEELIG